MIATLEDLKKQVISQNYKTVDNVDKATLDNLWKNYKNPFGEVVGTRDDSLLCEFEEAFEEYKAEYQKANINQNDWLERDEFEVFLQWVFDTLIKDKEQKNKEQKIVTHSKTEQLDINFINSLNPNPNDPIKTTLTDFINTHGLLTTTDKNANRNDIEKLVIVIIDEYHSAEDSSVLLGQCINILKDILNEKSLGNLTAHLITQFGRYAGAYNQDSSKNAFADVMNSASMNEQERFWFENGLAHSVELTDSNTSNGEITNWGKKNTFGSSAQSANPDSYNTEKKSLLETGLFKNDGIIDANEMRSEAMKDYLVRTLDLNIEYPENQAYLKNVIEFLVTLVDDTQLNVHELIMLFAGDINEYSIQDLAKKLEHTVDLSKPELINGRFRQSSEGNCWLLSAVGAFHNSQAGRKLIDQAVEKNLDGTYTVTFPAYPKNTYTITQQDIEKSTLVHDGDETDKEKILTALNIAAEKLMNDTDWREGSSNLYGGSGQDFAKLFSINADVYYTDDANKETIKEYLEKNPQNPNLSFYAKAGGSALEIIPSENAPDYNHLFYVKSYDASTQTVTYINPWDSSKEHKIPFDDFIKYTGTVEIFKL